MFKFTRLSCLVLFVIFIVGTMIFQTATLMWSFVVLPSCLVLFGTVLAFCENREATRNRSQPKKIMGILKHLRKQNSPLWNNKHVPSI
jgi:L-asparagine transporter-like permease